MADETKEDLNEVKQKLNSLLEAVQSCSTARATNGQAGSPEYRVMKFERYWMRIAGGEAKAKERAEALLARAREVGLDAAAKEMGLEVRTTGLFAHRAGSIPQLGAAPELREAAFALTATAPLAGRVYDVGGDSVVAALAEEQDASMAGFESEKAALQDSLLARKRQAVYGRHLADLKKQAMDKGALLVRADALGTG